MASPCARRALEHFVASPAANARSKRQRQLSVGIEKWQVARRMMTPIILDGMLVPPGRGTRVGLCISVTCQQRRLQQRSKMSLGGISARNKLFKPDGD